FVFFFSSRRRHTRFSRDWSSDVCSSDLALAAHDHRFHVLLLRIAGNDVVREAFERTRFHLHQFRYAFAASMAPASVAEHRAIAEAVVAGDPEAARSAMTAHLRAARDRIVRSQTSDSRDTR